MDKELKVLFDAALKARKNSYSPYSKFKVGAAVLTGSGKIYSGANIENASYGATVCAERIAIFKAVSEGEKSIEKIALVTDTAEFTAPCGICRQVMSEFNSNLEIYLFDMKGNFKKHELQELLPEQFRL